MLLKEELIRYKQQIILPEFNLQGQEKLKKAKVLLVGAGGLGCPILQYLVGAGVGCIGIVDADCVDESNLHRQVLYSTLDIGKCKAGVAKEKLQLLNPLIQIEAYPERLTDRNASLFFEKYDLIIDGSDNFQTRYLVNDVCVARQKTLVFGSIFKFEGQVAVFNYQGSSNYRDVFPELVSSDEIPNCTDSGVIGPLAGIIGTYMANEAVKIICNIGEILFDRLMVINALDNSVTIFKLRKQYNFQIMM